MENEKKIKTHAADIKRQRRINRQSTLLTFALIVVLAGATYFIVRNSSTSVTELAEGDAARHVPAVELKAFAVEAGEVAKPLKVLPSAGREIAFELSTIRPIHVALAAAVNDESPLLVFKGAKIPPGPDRRLEKEDFLYRYTVRLEDVKVKFCVLYASDAEQLRRESADLRRQWPNLAPEACVLLSR